MDPELHYHAADYAGFSLLIEGEEFRGWAVEHNWSYL